MAFSDLNLDVELQNNYHLGHVILECFKRRHPEDICYINGATDEKETFKSVLDRTISLARSLGNLGLKPGDVIALSGYCHINLPIPFYAGHLAGLTVAGVDPQFKYVEIKSLLKIIQPKLVFCLHKMSEIFKQAAKDLNQEVIVVTFDKGEFTMEHLIEKYGNKKPIDKFVPANIDIKKTYAWLVTTSGVTGVPKVVTIKHQFALSSIRDFINLSAIGTFVKGRPQKLGLMLATVQCMTMNVCAIGMPLVNTTLLMTSDVSSVDVIVDIVNKYKPSFFPICPSYVALMLECETPCNFTCFDNISIGGSKVYKDMIVKLQDRVRKDSTIVEAYGCTEVMAAILTSKPGMPLGCCGTVTAGRRVKLVDLDGNEITKPFVPGELLYKGPKFSKYYKNPEETAKIFTKDGWLRTGDQLYRDDNGLYYYVERMKMIMKYRGIHIIPTELEEVILTHPGVLEVCVTGLEHPIDGQWPVACVVRKAGADVTAQEIKDIVAENLSDTKKLRGGVIFMDTLPKTSTGKVARMKLKEYAANNKRD